MFRLPIFSPIVPDGALLALRIALGLILLYHGMSERKSAVVAVRDGTVTSFRPRKFWERFVRTTETFGGFLLIAGGLTQLVAGILVVQFIVINAWDVYHGKTLQEAELDLLMLASLTALLSFGAGSVAVDHIFSATP